MRRVGLLAVVIACFLAGPWLARAQVRPPEAYRVASTWLAQPQARPAGELTGPAGADTADDGTVFVVDNATSNIHVLAPDGTGLRLIGRPGGAAGQLSAPRDVDWDAGRLFVTDTGNRRVQALDAATGVMVAQWTSPGRPWGIAVTPTRVFVSDADTPVLYVTDRGGARLGSWGPGLAVDLPLVTPRGLAVDPAGNLYVADPGAGGLHVVAPDGTLIKTLVRADTAPAFREVWDVAADDVAAYAVVRRQVFAWTTPTGPQSYERPGQYHFGAQGIALGPGRGVAVTEINDRTHFVGLSLYAERDNLNALPVRGVGTVPVPLGSLSGPRRLVNAADGGAWLLDAWPRVQRWAAGGAPVRHFRAEGLADLARAPGDDIYLVTGGAVQRVAPDGNPRWHWPTDLTGTALVAAAADGGDLLAVDAGNERLVRLSPDGAATSLSLAGTIVDVAVAGGTLGVLDRAAGAVRLLDGAGNELRRWPAPWGAQRLAVGLDGAAWFVLSGDGWVWKYAADGALRAVFEGAPGGRPVDLDADRRGWVQVVDGGLDRVVIHAPDAAGTPSLPPNPGDRCALNPDKTAAPAALRIGAPVTVTLTVAGHCPAESIQMDLVLALDRSGSMEGPKLAGAKSAAIGFTSEMDFRRVQAAVVSFNQGADLVQPLTGDRATVVRAVAGLQPAGLTNLADPVTTALAELTGPRGRPGAVKVIVLMTDGRPEGSTADEARAAAAAARAAGAQLYIVGLGGDVDGSLLVDMAGDSDRYFETPNDAGLAQIYTLIARRLITNILFRTLTLVDRLPANMAYVPGSAVPAAAWDGSALTWSLPDVPSTGFSLTYRVVPQAVGRWPTNVRADGSYEDGVGFQGTVTFPVPYVDVAAVPTVVPPTPVPHYAYLPLVYKHRCPQQRSDIVLAIDASSSMLQPSPGSTDSKLAAAKAAAVDFVRFLGLPLDQAAVVGFNRTAVLAQPLTGDQARVIDAILRLEPAVGTRIDLGLAKVYDEITSRRRIPGHVPVVVLLSDGQPEGGSADATRAQAARLRQAGVTVFAIGLGADADGALLVDLAGGQERYYYAPTQDDLKEIYRAIAWALPCE